MKRYLLHAAHIVLMFSATKSLIAQQQSLSDCFGAFDLSFPVNQDEFSALELAADDAPVVRYLFEDQFTFWYRLTSNRTDTLKFTISPSDENDHFQALLYEQNDSLFCYRLVAGEVEPEQVLHAKTTTHSTDKNIQVWSYSVILQKDQPYFLSVLSLNGDHCGHRIEYTFDDESIHFHAMNKPCYQLPVIDFAEEATSELPEDPPPALQLNLSEQPVDTSIIKQESTERSVAEAPEKMNQMKPGLEAGHTDRSITGVTSSLANLDLKSGVKLNLKQVFFHNNTYAFRSDSHEQLNELAEMLRDNPEVVIEISGHTAGNTKNIKPNPYHRDRGKGWDFKGSAKKLSQKRADAVKDYLVEKGISGKRLKTIGKGDEEKIIQNPRTPDDHRQNMRVEIEIISAE